jgi:hypothetical protein
MKQTGILFSTPMVQALQRGKTVTRRTRGLEEINKEPEKWKFIKKWADENLYIFERDDGSFWRLKCPYGGKGDMLRIKETWKTEKIFDNTPSREIPYCAIIEYLASPDPIIALTTGKVRPSIFLPLRFSRYFLPLIADPIPERVQSITEAEAIAEGLSQAAPVTAGYRFRTLWDTLNAKRGYSWASNPWVWPLRFKPLTGARG